MNNIGFKIVDKDEDIVYDIVKEAAKLSVPVELGLYGGSDGVREYCHKNSFPKNIHFNHIVYSLCDLPYKNREIFYKEIEIAKFIGADYGVHHMAKYPISGQKGYYSRVIKKITNEMLYVEKISAETDFPIYIENTFESVSFYKDIFENLKKHECQNLNFCFDIGHAKVWSGDDFFDWMSFLHDLKDEGFGIHFHLHGNEGLIDSHLSYIELQEDNIGGDDGVFSKITYKQMFEYIFKNFKHERKIFEVKPHLAIENLKKISSIF